MNNMMKKLFKWSSNWEKSLDLNLERPRQKINNKKYK